MHRASALVLLLVSICACQGQQLPPGVIPIPDAPAAPVPAALTAAPTQAITPTATVVAPAAYPAAVQAAYPAAAGLPAPAAFPAAATAFPTAAAAPAAALPAQTAALPAPAAALPAPAAALPAPAVAAPAGVPLGQFGDPLAAAGYPSGALAVPAAAANPYAMPATAGFPAAVGLPAAGLPGAAAAIPDTTVIAVPTVGGAAAPGALPGAAGAVDPMMGLGGPTLPAGLLPGNINQMIPAPPPRARPAAPPAPPIPTGASWKPQWDDLKDFTESDVIVSFNVANTMEQVFWNQKKVREAMAKSGGVLPNAVSYYQVLPSADDYGRPFTTVRFVVQNRNAELASNLITSLNDEKTQTNLKNRIEEVKLDIIGDSMKAQTPTDYKASARGAPLPSSTMMDTAGGLNGVAAAGAVGPAGVSPIGMNGSGVSALPGMAGPSNVSANSTAGLPGLGAPGGMASTLAERRRQASGAGTTSAAVVGAIMPLLLAVGALVL